MFFAENDCLLPSKHSSDLVCVGREQGEARLSVPRYEETGRSDQVKPFLAVPWHRSVLEMPDGSLLAAIYGRFEEDRTPSEYAPSMFRFRSFTVISHDRGKNWSFLSTIASAPVEQEGFDEPVMVRLTHGEHQGRLVCLMRTGRVSPIYQSESDNDGKNWTPAHPLRWMYSKLGHWRDVVGTDPDLVEMQDGALAVSFGHKPDFEDDGNFIAFSTNQGETWTQAPAGSAGFPHRLHAFQWNVRAPIHLCGRSNPASSMSPTRRGGWVPIRCPPPRIALLNTASLVSASVFVGFRAVEWRQCRARTRFPCLADDPAGYNHLTLVLGDLAPGGTRP